MDKSVLFDRQQRLSATFGEYGRWTLPQWYTDIQEEYWCARNDVVLMDRTCFGQLRLSGADHVDLLHRITTNELRKLKPGEGQINIFANEKGRIVERVILQKLQDAILLVTPPGAAPRVATWIDKFTFIEDVQVEDLSTSLSTLTIFGPRSTDFLSSLMANDLENLPKRHFMEFAVESVSGRISRSDELDVRGYDLVVAGKSAVELWDLLLEAGTRFNLKPMGEEAYEILRIESGWPLPQKDYDDTINPHEAQMLAYVNFDKGCYIGQEVIARLDTYEKVQKYLTGLILDGEIPPSPQGSILLADKKVGHITSLTYSPIVKQPIALGYVAAKALGKTKDVRVRFDEHEHTGRLVELPFNVMNPEVQRT